MRKDKLSLQVLILRPGLPTPDSEEDTDDGSGGNRAKVFGSDGGTMRAFLVMMVTVACMVGLSSLVTPALAAAPAGVVALPQPEATKTKKAKKTKKPQATPTPTPIATPTHTPTPRGRTDAELEGDRWVQVALVAGGGLLGSVLAFFGIGALMRSGRRRRVGS